MIGDIFLSVFLILLTGTVFGGLGYAMWVEEIKGSYFHLKMKSLAKRPEDRYTVDIEVVPNPNSSYFKWKWEATAYTPESAGRERIVRTTGRSESVRSAWRRAKSDAASSIFDYEELQEMSRAQASKKTVKF